MEAKTVWPARAKVLAVSRPKPLLAAVIKIVLDISRRCSRAPCAWASGRSKLIDLAACRVPCSDPLSSSMDQYRDLGMGEYLDRLAAEDERGDAVAAVRGHDDEVTAFRHRGIDDRLVGMLILDMDPLA